MTYLLSIGTDAKTVHGEQFGVLTGVQYLAPANASGVMNTCPDATEGCKASCLFTAGRARQFKTVNQARIARTVMFVENKREYFSKLVREIHALIRKANRQNMIPAVRLNGTSDIPWERVKIKGTEFDGLTLMQAFPFLQFYDYTKSIHRVGNTPSNYYLTASYSETMSLGQMNNALNDDHNVVVVFRVCEHQATCACSLPETWQLAPGEPFQTIINGDESDIRFNDPQGVIVGVKAKGAANNDHSGFVIRI